MRPGVLVLALALLPALAGCRTLSDATEDRTRLRGEIPTGLGRILEVNLKGGDEDTRTLLCAALEREFVRSNLFERVRLSEAEGRGAAVLRVTVVKAGVVDFFDLFEFSPVYVSRYELAIELEDERGREVLAGQISGLGADTVTDAGERSRTHEEDVRRAALDDAAMKISRALRQAANARAERALERVRPVKLAPGRGRTRIAVLGFDDAKGARQRRGALLRDKVAVALERLGGQVEVTERARVRLALERERLPEYLKVPVFRLENLAPHLPQSNTVLVGSLRRAEGRVFARARLLTLGGRELAAVEASSSGLGALGVVAAKLAGRLGEKLSVSKAKKPGKGEKPAKGKAPKESAPKSAPAERPPASRPSR